MPGEWDSPSEALQGKHKHFPDLLRYDAVLAYRYLPLERHESKWREDYDEADSTARTDWRGKVMTKQPEGEAGA